MRKLFKVLGVIAILTVLLLSFAGCDGPDLGGNTGSTTGGNTGGGTDTYEPVVYTSFDPEGTMYELTITRTGRAVKEFTPATGDSYTLTITTTAGVTQTSTGQITVDETTFTLEHTGTGETFSVTVSADGAIVSVTGDIPIDNSPLPVSAPIMLAPAVAPNKTPVASDYDIDNLTQTEGSVTAVTITPKAGKSSGKITIYYTYYSTNGPSIGNIPVNVRTSTTLPTTAGSYKVTFNVAAALGWNPATGLDAGWLKINPASPTNQTPVASDYDIGNLAQTAGSVTAVTITPKAGKSSGTITIKYAGSTTIPQTAGTYAVTFDVAEATGWNAAIGLSAGTLTIALSGGGGNNAVYIITGSGTFFTTNNGGATIGSGTIQDVINAIRTHATGTNPTIQFGNGNELDIGEATASFNNSGGTWGVVTLVGKITSAAGGFSENGIKSTTIYIDNSVSVTSTADIKNCNSAEVCAAITHNSTGALTISGGTVSATSGQACHTVLNKSTGAVNITGGTVSGAASAVTNENGGTVTISGGTVSTPLMTVGVTVINYNGTVSITGGTVSTIGRSAVFNENGAVTISGGTVSATERQGHAVQFSTFADGVVRITGGTISATSGSTVYIPRGTLTVSGTAKVTSANTTAVDGTIYLISGTLEINGGTVENTSTTTGNAIYNASGKVSITGGTVSKAGDGNYAVYNGGSGAITIGPKATIKGNNYGF